MLWMKHLMTTLILTLTRAVAAIGMIGCLNLAFAPVGCTNTIEMAPVLYREQHPTGHRLPDFTVERLQACVEEHASDLDEDSLRVGATVQVDREGQTQKVTVTGIPASASDLAGCTRITLRDMMLPGGVLQMRRQESTASTSGQTVHHGNEAANPAVFVDVAILLGEFMAQHGGKAVLYAVTIEVLGAIAVAGTQEMIKRRRWQNECQRKLNECLASSLGSRWGDVHGTSRCAMCFKRCDKNGWPSGIQIDDDEYATCLY